jgi:orotate phosphoribosyltransferase
MFYRDLDDLAAAIRVLYAKLPPISLVVGIPRSGLLTATMFALLANIPLTDVDGYLSGRVMSHGVRDLADNSAARVLVLDDTVNLGAEMHRVRSLIPNRDGVELIFAAAFVTHAGRGAVDYYAEIIDTPRVFEWNILHHPEVKDACCDIDGVLCPDPPSESILGGAPYLKHIQNAPCLFRPSIPFGHLVTNRLERYRDETETWLAKNGIGYGDLIMRPEQSVQDRREGIPVAQFKAEVYERTNAWLFIESSLPQARQIAEITHRPVFCTEVWRMIYSGGDADTSYYVPSRADTIRWILTSRPERAYRRLRFVLGRTKIGLWYRRKYRAGGTSPIRDADLGVTRSDG